MIVGREFAVLVTVATGAGAGQGFLGGHQHGAFFGLINARTTLGSAPDFQIEINLAAQTQSDGVHGGQIGGIPVRGLAHRVDGRLGGADQTHDLGVLEFGMIAYQPLDGVGTLIAAGNRGVARALALGSGDANLGFAELEAVGRIGFGLFDLFARQLTVLDRVGAHDAAGDVAIGNTLNFERMQCAEGGDLVERQRSVVDEPNGSRLGHQQWLGHDKSLLQARPVFLRTAPPLCFMLRGNFVNIWIPGLIRNGNMALAYWLVGYCPAPKGLTSTSLPMRPRASMLAWACAACSIGKLVTMGLVKPGAASAGSRW